MVKILFMIAATLALAITLAVASTGDKNHETTFTRPPVVAAFPNRASRFLVENKNPLAADHCKKDNEICYILEGKNSTCCNKCMDLSEDKHNCGACKNKCKFTSSCCRGECVNLAYDKRHCGSCGNKCMHGGYCIYGLCNYA